MVVACIQIYELPSYDTTALTEYPPSTDHSPCQIKPIPERPDIPDKPDKPEIPELPLKPEMPEMPLRPEIPDKPEIPERPEIPDAATSSHQAASVGKWFKLLFWIDMYELPLYETKSLIL